MRAIVLVSSALLSSVAASQPSAPPLVDRAAVHFNEIERGINVGVGAGYFYLLHAPVSSGTGPSTSGLTVRVDLSYDIGERLSVGIFGMATAHKAGADYFGKSGGTASGDFSALIPGATLRVNAVGFNDSQEVKRVWLYARGGVGYVIYWPTKLLPQSDALAFAGIGLEYFTPMRHFSIALEALGTDLLQASSLGFALTPVVRYAF